MNELHNIINSKLEYQEIIFDIRVILNKFYIRIR